MERVERIRARVAEWERNGYPYATPTTAALLAHWQHPDRDDPQKRHQRLYFAQLEAIKTLVWLHEAAPHTASGQTILADFAEQNALYNDGMTRYCTKMATGAGKTLVMALAVIWQASNYAHDPDAYANSFAVIAPGLTVKERLTSGLLPDPVDHNDIYRTMDLLPDDGYRQCLAGAHIQILNYHRMAVKDADRGMSAKAARLAGYQGMREEPTEMLARALDHCWDSASRIMVLNDEGHHCNNTAADIKSAATDTIPQPDIWYNGIRALAQQQRLYGIVDFSATPSFIRTRREALFPWIVSDYPLTDAIEAGIVKIPRIPVSSNVPSENYPVYRDIYNLTEEKPKDILAVGSTRNKDLKEAFIALYEGYERIDAEWRERNEPLPPVVIAVMNSVKNATQMFEYVSAPTNFRLLSNTNYVTGKPLRLPQTVLMHSKMENPDITISGTQKQYLERQAAAFRTAYPRTRCRDGVTGKVLAFREASDRDVMRYVLNTVGKAGEPGAQVRCVISVNMLTEGWDTRTVTHIIGYRAFQTQLLCEQVTGRGLRRTNYDLPEGMDRFAPQYVDILGIPYHYIDETDNTQLPPPPLSMRLNRYRTA